VFLVAALALSSCGDNAMGGTRDGPRGPDGSAPDALAPDGRSSDAGGSDAGAPDATGTDGGPSTRGFRNAGPWVSFYGSASQIADLTRVADTFRIINVDADPGAGNFTDAELTTLQAGGRNQVISYLNLGSCEMSRTYWSSAPAGLLSCSANTAAQRGPYQGYPDEVWMDVGNADYQRLILEHVSARIATRGVDGFFLDNLEIVEHGTNTQNGPCDAACSQGGLDLVRRLRERYPSLLIVMQNATSDVTRQGTTGGLAYPSLLDGISHEEVYAPSYDMNAESELLRWQALGLMPGGHSFWIATEDYVGSCSNTTGAQTAYMRSRANGFSPYASDASGSQNVICFWGF